jgi:hypothetical protein
MMMGAIARYRHHLRADDPRQQALFQRAHVHDQDGQHNAEQRADGEADGGCRKRHPGVIDEAAR